MLRRTLLKLRKFLPFKMASAEETKVGEKRMAETVGESNNKKSKKMDHRQFRQQPQQEVGRADRKRKCALLIAYNGKGYYGLQINPGFQTIESELCKALLEVGLIPQAHHDCMQKMSFQRAARTDKGVSAAGNVVSLKMLINMDNLVDKLNEKLPAQIRVMDYVRTTNGFNSKNFCDARTYIYVLPTYAFAPVEEKCTNDYRINVDIIERVNEVLEKFIGTHNFHNFTSGMKPTDSSAKRYMKEFECRLPFVRDGVEFCVLSVTGQSFMLHQIRKMIGLTIPIVKGFCGIEVIDEAWKHEKFDIPKAPGLGLILEKLHYNWYNDMYGNDGQHKKIEWNHIRDKLDSFKEEQIFSEILKQEIAEQSMMTWLATLHNHSFAAEDNWFYKRKAIGNALYGKNQDESTSEKEPLIADKTANESEETANTSNQDQNTEKIVNQSEDTSSSNSQEKTVETNTSSRQIAENDKEIDCVSDKTSEDNKNATESGSDVNQSENTEILKTEEMRS